MGEFRRGRKARLSLECIVALRDQKEAEEIARKKLIGADTITATELSRAELMALKIGDGDVFFSASKRGRPRVRQLAR